MQETFTEDGELKLPPLSASQLAATIDICMHLTWHNKYGIQQLSHTGLYMTIIFFMIGALSL